MTKSLLLKQPDKEHKMTKSYLLPVDLEQQSSWEHALPVASKLANDDGATLHVLSVIPDFGMSVVGSFFPADYSSKALAEAEKVIAGFVDEHFEDSSKVKTHVRLGTIYKEIISAADELGCSVIIMASHRPERKDYLLGPNAARVVRHANQSVYVVRG